MILQFWLGALLLLIFASLAFIATFLGGKKSTQRKNARNQLNKNLYEIRLAEVEADEAQGKITDKHKIIAELQHNLLDDISDQESKTKAVTSALIWLPGLLILVLGSATLYWSVGGYSQLENWQAALQRYPSLKNELLYDKKSRPTEQELRDIMLGLRSDLMRNSNNADGWLLYSRLGLVFKDSGLALDAIKKAYALAPDSIEIRLVYIQLKMQQGDEYSQSVAENMVVALLKDHPQEADAWSIYAFMALEKQDFSGAITRWQQMLTFVDSDSEQAAIIRNSIVYAQKQMKNNNVVASSEAVEPIETIEKETIENGHYRVQVSVATTVDIPEDGFLFLFAQPVSGPDMPIATVRLPILDFPINVDLSDDDSMMEGIKLSDYPAFIIKARLSPDANVDKAEGQWQGQSEVISSGFENKITILISKAL